MLGRRKSQVRVTEGLKCLAKGFRLNYYSNISFKYFKKENEMIGLESICVDLYILKRSYKTGSFH